MVPAKTARVLARCNGFRVKAGGQLVGAVATPVFSGGNLLPEYLLVRVEAAIPGIFRAVTPDLVAAADAVSETLVLKLDAAELASLPVPDVLERGSATPLMPPLAETTRDESANRDDVWTRGVRHYGALVRHHMATPLTVIRGSALTLCDLPGLPSEEVRQLAHAIERATQDLERATLEPSLFEVGGTVDLDGIGPPPTEKKEAGPSHREIAMRIVTRATAIAARKTLTQADMVLLELDILELRGRAQ